MDVQTMLWDIEQIKQLKARYIRLLDTKKWSQFRELFADDFRFYSEPSGDPRPDTKPSDTSADDFVRRISNSKLAPQAVMHQGHMPEIEITGENSARGIWGLSWYEFIDAPDRLAAFKQLGHYHELYVKEADGKWRIKESRVTTMRRETTVPNQWAGRT